MAPRAVILAQTGAGFTSTVRDHVSKTDRLAALIAWMLVVRVDDVVQAIKAAF
jgi:hypothetical protein